MRFSSFIQEKNPRYPRNSRNMIKIIPRVLGRKFQVETAKGLAKGFNLKCFFKRVLLSSNRLPMADVPSEKLLNVLNVLESM